MAKFKMKQLALAVGMAVGGMSLVPSAQAVNLATDGLGQALIFPYYTTRAGWNTLFNITNTSNDVVVAKVRFHEGYNSRDVFDFLVILSPHDVWNGTLSNGAGNVPIFSTSDTTCTVPAIPAGGQLFQGNGANGLLAYTGIAADSGPATTDRMREGYTTVMMMGTSPPPYTALAASAIHTGAGVPVNCAALRTAFSTGTPAGLTTIRSAFPAYTVNPLKGAFSLVNAASGWNAGGSTVTLADFFDPTLPPSQGGAPIPNLITAQLPPAQVPLYTDSFHEPELASANTPGEVLLASGGPLSTAPVVGADAVSYVLLKASVVNQWANLTASATSAWTVASDWVVTFPTKRLYADTATHEFSGRATAGGVNVNVTRPGLPTTLAPFTSVFANGRSCDTVGYSIYNREELLFAPTSGPVFSPAPTPQGNQLCEEVNVVTFGASPTATQTNVLGSPMPNQLAGNVPASSLPGANGWMQLNFLNAASALPVVGFAVLNRTDPNGILNESFIVNNAYIR